MKLFRSLFSKVLPAFVLFLLIFIPLYPKLPLVDIRNTWVYVRVEDFLVFFVLGFWVFLLIKNKVSLKTPLTIPIIIFWIVGAIATIHGVVIIFPNIAHVFPNVALLAYLRHIEYLSLFFVAYSATKSKKFVLFSVWTVVLTLILVIAYGFGQKFLSFPAYLTMNEEYAKGIPIIISPLNRISSTFAGHYDLAAYLVLVIPIVVSLMFGFRNIFIKAGLLVTALLGLVLMLMTVSRVSFFVVFIGLFLVLLFHKRKLALIFIPVAVILGAVFFFTQSSLLARFGNTVKEIDVLVDAKSGTPIGHVEYKPREYIYDKFIIHDPKQPALLNNLTPLQIAAAQNVGIPLPLAPYRLTPQIGVVQAEISSTGETLPQGSSYINLPLSPVNNRLSNFIYEYPLKEATTAATVKIVTGEYLVKRASAYDISFTTRFQGEWPNAIDAFKRNLLFGSGYGSVSLAVDNNYFRMLGETGLLGTLSFIAIFVVVGMYFKKMLPGVESRIIRSLVLGFSAGVVGLSFNAVLIDVFEASKVAFTLWLLTGIVVGAVSLYASKHFNIYKELLAALTSTYAVIVYLLIITIAVFSTTLGIYFIGDDFTWFRWAADCTFGDNVCDSPVTRISQYFFNSEGFFYRPGTKTYFLLMYPIFWLNQVVYHMVSLTLHFTAVVLLYFLARKIFKNNLLSSLTAIIFLLISTYLETVLWISATGHLFNAVLIMISLLLFIKWHETKKLFFLIVSLSSVFVSLTFYELGVVAPLLMIAYVVSFMTGWNRKSLRKALINWTNLIIFSPVAVYLLVRFFSHTHWFSGDYSYNLLKFPLNVAGNIFGYILTIITGPLTLPLYEVIRQMMRTNIPFAILVGIVVAALLVLCYRYAVKSFSADEKRIALFSVLFFIITLIPFLGLGNIALRYSYLATFGVIVFLVLIAGKLYGRLLPYGRDVATVSLTALGGVFVLFHIIQAQQVMIDWNGAGGRVEKFLTSIDSLYNTSWSDHSLRTDLYFSNVLIKNGNAWIFPVGLEDAVWFAFKNDNIHVHQHESLDTIPNDAYNSLNKWVFEFDWDGSLKRMVIDRRGEIVEYEE